MTTPLTLYIDLASADPLFGLVHDDTVRLKHLTHSKNDATILPVLASLLEEDNVTWKEIDRIALVTGPGGFMSIRVGAALANALSFSLGIPSGGIHMSDVWRARVPRDSSYLWLHSTKRTHLFTRGIGMKKAADEEPALMTIEECRATVQAGAWYAGDLLPEHEAMLGVKRYPHMSTLERVLPAMLANITYEKGRMLQPWYGRGA